VRSSSSFTSTQWYPASVESPTWLELALDYRCNLRCIGCHACHDTGESMSASAAVEALRRGRERGSTRLWLGGGEPTLRSDLFAIIRAARSLGYDEVLLQTNGMRLSYAAYREAVVAAGVTEIRFNVKSHRAEVHDRLSRAPCHALLLAALAGLAGMGPKVSADVLLTRSGLADLPQVIPFYAERGVSRFVLWLLSAADSTEAEVLDEVPTFTELQRPLAVAAKSAASLGVALESLHTPPCTLPADLRHLYLPSSELGLVVTDPTGRTFPLETSPFEGGAFLPSCSACAARSRCGGPRADYVKLHGAEELVPIAR
jgi:MoaA/NifB/PqqE/SkfB family radical SAM enzyme